jgi:alkylated DNA repair protein alkB family protein 6
MATSIDFQALLKQERDKLSNQRKVTPPNNAKHQPKLRVIGGLESYRVGTLEKLYYIPNYINSDDEREILDDIKRSEKSKPWVSLTQRRLQNWGGVPHPNGMLRESLPPFLNSLMGSLVTNEIFEGEHNFPNHILLNEYTGTKGIAPHKDGELYYPKAAILSLVSPIVIDFLKDVVEGKDSKEGAGKHSLADKVLESVLLMPRSLLVFEGKAYTELWHGISTREFDNIGGTNSKICNLESEDVEASGICQSSTKINRKYRLSITMRTAKLQEREELLTLEQAEEKKRRETQWLQSIAEKRQDSVSW